VKSTVFQLGDVRFDTHARTLTLSNGGEAQLRNKSKDVLLYLLETPNQTVLKTALLERVWADVTVTDESLVQCIADIRKIIGTDAKRVLETIPREGYRINAEPKTTNLTRGRLAALCLGLVAVCIVTWSYWPKAETLPLDIADANPAFESQLGTNNKEAYLEVLKGRVSSNQFSHGESLVAERHFRRAISLDTNFARAHAELGTLLAVRFENNWAFLEDADKDKSLYYAERAISLDPDLWLGHYALGRLHSVFENFDAAETHLQTAMSLEPDKEDARAYLGIVKNFRGDAESAIAILDAAVRSHPNPPHWYYFGLGHAYFNAGDIDQADAALRKCLQLAENSPYCLRYYIALLGQEGRYSEARQFGETYAAMGFELSVSSILKLMSFHHPNDRLQLAEALRLAGLPD
jgi:DNA-binding winged helix-turn-helix (wHTH) protein/Flp pilus assembly protein TadD